MLTPFLQGVYATNKARGRRRRAAAQRQNEQRSRLPNLFSITGGRGEGGGSGSSAVNQTDAEDEGVDNPNFNGDHHHHHPGGLDLVAPPPYALVVEAGLLDAERRRQV